MIQIKCRFTAKVLFEFETDSMKVAVDKAIEAKADLRSADLRSADLRSADLSSADLSSADLRSADLRSANLSSADLRYANLKNIKEDFFKVLSAAKTEVAAIYDAILRGNVDGSVYCGECACLVGTIANARKEHHEKLSIDLRPDADRPAERWFLGIRKGDVPTSNQISAITQGWIEEFSKENQIELPKYKLVSSSEHPAIFA